MIGDTWAPDWRVHGPTAEDMARAQRSTTARREVDEHYARWLGLPEDEVGPFLERLRLFDLRTPAFEEKLAADELVAQRGRREQLEERRIPLEAPRITAPRIYAPRAA